MRFDSYRRVSGSSLCRVARCPNELGDSPWRYCLEHAPEDLKPFMQVLEKYEPMSVLVKRRMGTEGQEPKKRPHKRVDYGSDSRAWKINQILLQIKKGNCQTGEIRIALGMSESFLKGALTHLLATKQIVRVKPGTYAIPKPPVRELVLEALKDGQKTLAELRVVAQGSGALRDALALMVENGAVVRVQVGVYALPTVRREAGIGK